MGLTGTLEEQAEAFLLNAKKNNGAKWIQANILRFATYYKQEIENKKLSAGTLKNCFYGIKLFRTENEDDIPAINWRKISRGLPTPITKADDMVFLLKFLNLARHSASLLS